MSEQRKYFKSYVDKAVKDMKDDLLAQMKIIKQDLDHVNAQVTSWFRRIAQAVDGNQRALSPLDKKVENFNHVYLSSGQDLESAIEYITNKVTDSKDKIFQG